MGKNNNKPQESDWWLDKWIMKLVSPLIRLFPEPKEKETKSPKATKPPKVVNVVYGSSEPCYCGSEKKYKYCCKKENKKEGKIAYKIIRNTRKGQKIKIKVEKPQEAPRLFESPMYDSGIDATQYIDFD